MKKRLEFALIVFILLLAASVLTLSSVPPVSRDALTHHLALPKLYLANGSVFELPDRVFSYYPMNLDLMYLLPLYLGNDIIAKYMHFFFALMTAFLVFHFLKKKIGSGFGLFGALLFLSTPVVIKLSTTAYVDLGLAFFSTAALLSLLKWREQNFKRRYLIVASIWCGLALGTKYHGLIVFFILTILLLLFFTRITKPEKRSTNQVLNYLITFAGVALIIFSPWMIRNVIWTNNPIYPLFSSTFRPVLNDKSLALKTIADPGTNKAHGLQKRATLKLNHFSYRAIAFEESGLDIILVPLRIFFQGRDGKPKYFDGALNPLLLLLPLFILAGNRDDSKSLKIEITALFAFAGLFIMIIFFAVDMRVRYVLPAVPPLAILASYGLRNLLAMPARIPTKHGQNATLGLICLLVAGLFMQNGRYLVGLFKIIRPLPYISGHIERDAYIEQFRPAITVHRYAGQHLKKDAKILGLFLGYRSYYSDRDLVFGNPIFKNAVKQSENAGQIARYLQSQGLTHLLIRYDLFDRWINDNFTDTEKERGRLFFSGFATRLFTERGYGLYAIGTAG